MRPIAGLACIALGIGSAPAVAAAGGPTLRARAAVVMDARTGDVLYAKDPDRRLPPASTTKVMTAVVALESGLLDDTVTVSRMAAGVQPIKLYLRAGERARMRDLVYAMLLRSANDASVAVAERVGGSVPGFAVRMNRRAAALGARNTHFVNPNGLPARGHYSTARDLATILRHAMSLPGFRDVAATPASRVTAWRGAQRRSIAVRNTNRLLQSYRAPVIGKTGYTRAAKRCFVGAVEAQGRQVIIALLGSTDLWGDARRLLDYGLAHASTGTSEPLQIAAHDGRKDAGVTTRLLAMTAPAAGLPPGVAIETSPYSLLLMPTVNNRDAAERLRLYVDRRGHVAVVEVVGRPRHYQVRILGLTSETDAVRAQAALQRENLHPTLVPPG
jgi:D-alanyl-D-alanine carboxypeptidase (penicillin-binding protein 5/6)